jgi:MerR family transcriptional regulator, thiopeptide resistance regulator
LHLTPRQELASLVVITMDERRWKVGELAAVTGVTVRTLHHFDEIGLLHPAERSPVGHRLYTTSDVQRLYRILALRQVGISLSEIATSLDGDVDQLELVVQHQLAQVEQQLTAHHQLRHRLMALLDAMQNQQEPSIDQLIDTMEAMMQASYFTPDQLARLKERHRQVGGEGFTRWQRQWAQLAEEAEGHLERRTDPADAAVQDLARRWSDLMDDMTGGDRAIRSSMYAKLDGKGPEAATLGIVKAPVWDYLKRAFAVGFSGPR